VRPARAPLAGQARSLAGWRGAGPQALAVRARMAGAEGASADRGGDHKGFEVNLSGAGLASMVADSATFSTVLDVSATVLECYYGTSQP
jgi:hypothetical protein